MLSIGCDARWVTLPSGPVAWQLSPACWAATAVRLHITSSRWMPGCRRSAPVWERTASGTSPMPCCRLGLVVSGGIRGISCCFSCPSGPLWRQRWSGQVCGWGGWGTVAVEHQAEVSHTHGAAHPKIRSGRKSLVSAWVSYALPTSEFFTYGAREGAFSGYAESFLGKRHNSILRPRALGPPGESRSLEKSRLVVSVGAVGFNVPPGCRCNAPGCLALIQVSQVRLIVVPPHFQSRIRRVRLCLGVEP